MDYESVMPGLRQLRRLMTAALVALAWGCGSSGTADDSDAVAVDCSSTRWLGAWAAAPSDVTDVFSGESLRLLVTPLRSGDEARVRLSNRFGEGPLTLSSVHLAVQEDGASVRPATQTAMTFEGLTTVTIPAGEEVVSDEVAFQVEAFQPLAVSVYVPEPGGVLTRHSLAMQTSYRAPASAGDVAAAESGDVFTGTLSDRPLVVGLSVRASGRGAVIAMVGDSLTDGDQNTSGGIDANTRYPDELARRLADAESTLSPVNLGIAGNRVISGPLLPTFGPSLLERLDADVLARDDVTDVVLWEGINDLGIPPGSSAQEVLAGLADAVDRLKAPRAGQPVPRVLVATLTPAGGASGVLVSYANADEARQQINTELRAGAIGDGFLDFDAAVRDPNDPTRLAAEYDGGDGLHLSAAGYQRLAEVVELESFAGRACAD